MLPLLYCDSQRKGWFILALCRLDKPCLKNATILNLRTLLATNECYPVNAAHQMHSLWAFMLAVFVFNLSVHIEGLHSLEPMPVVVWNCSMTYTTYFFLFRTTDILHVFFILPCPEFRCFSEIVYNTYKRNPRAVYLMKFLTNQKISCNEWFKYKLYSIGL